jgi:D-3-phosphoglycerate dehydrogenase
MKCAILDDYQRLALEVADWKPLAGALDVVRFTERLATEEDIVTALVDADILVLMRERTAFPRTVLERLPRLKLIVTMGMRNAVIDMAATRERGIEVCGTAFDSISTAELVFAFMLNLARGVSEESARLHEDGEAWYTSRRSSDLQGAMLGLLGLGRVGGRVAEIAGAFGMDVVAWSDNLTADRARLAGARLVSREELFSLSDYLSVHLQLSERTRGLVAAADIARMKPTAVLINTSRGPIVDEGVLVAALRSSRIAAAALDVFDIEPLPAAHPFRSLPNAHIAPHIGYATERYYRENYGQAIDAIHAFLAGKPIRKIPA